MLSHNRQGGGQDLMTLVREPEGFADEADDKPDDFGDEGGEEKQ